MNTTQTNNEGARQTVRDYSRELVLESGPSYEYQRETRHTYRHPDGRHSNQEEETRQTYRHPDGRHSNQELNSLRDQEFRHSSQDLRSHRDLQFKPIRDQEYRQTSQEVRNHREHESQTLRDQDSRLNVREERTIPISKEPKTVRSHVALHKDHGSRTFQSPDPKDPNESRRVRSHVTRSYESSQIYKGNNELRTLI